MAFHWTQQLGSQPSCPIPTMRCGFKIVTSSSHQCESIFSTTMANRIFNFCSVLRLHIFCNFLSKALLPFSVSFEIRMPSQKTTLTLLATGAALGVGVYYLYLQQQKKPKAKIYPDKDTVSKELCAFIVAEAKKAINQRGVFHLAVAGGSLIDALAGLEAHKGELDFSNITLSFCNHKCVAPGNEKATVFKSRQSFADAVGITTFVLPTASPASGGDGSAEAEYYAKQLQAYVPHNGDGYPVIDLILLGLGADGHIGSNHPMGPAVKETIKTVAGSPKEGEPSSITLTIESINAARKVAVVVCGGSSGKKEAVKRAMARPAEEPRGTFPAQLLQSPIFFLDKEAAADL
jgi:6-phosphogluconolactonase